jgi:hypothetical protein
VGAAALEEEIQVTIPVMSDEEQALPERYPNNYAAWDAYFRDHYERDLASYKRPPPPPARNNSDSRRLASWELLLDAMSDGIHVFIFRVGAALPLLWLYAAATPKTLLRIVNLELVSRPRKRGYVGGIVILERRGPSPPRG